MKNITGQRWSRTTGANLTDKGIGRKFKLMASKEHMPPRQADVTYTIMDILPILSNKHFTAVKVQSSINNDTLIIHVRHNQAYLVPEGQK